MDATAVCYIHCKKMPLRSSYAVFIFILLLSCQEDAVAPVKEPNPLERYLRDFLAEANKRNIKIDASRLTIKLADSTLYWRGKVVCALGGRNFRPFVFITDRYGCWQSRDTYYKKELLFHEFGHAFLGRPHDNVQLPNGSKKSIMNESATGSSFWNEDRLKYYIDELFDPSTPIPDWAK